MYKAIELNKTDGFSAGLTELDEASRMLMSPNFPKAT